MQMRPFSIRTKAVRSVSKTRSTRALLPSKGYVAKQTPVKWSIIFRSLHKYSWSATKYHIDPSCQRNIFFYLHFERWFKPFLQEETLWNAIPALWYLFTLFVVVFLLYVVVKHYTRWLINYIRSWSVICGTSLILRSGFFIICGACCIINSAFFFICGVYCVLRVDTSIIRGVLFIMHGKQVVIHGAILLQWLFPIICGAFLIICGG